MATQQPSVGGPGLSPVVDEASLDAQTAAAVQATLLSHPDPRVRLALARSASTSPEMLEGFAADGSADVRRSAASRDDCPMPALRLLAGDDSARVRFAVLERSQLPADVIESFAGDKERGIRRDTANRADCPPETLQRLASDPEPAVQATVAHNPGCPVDALDLLSRSNHPSCRRLRRTPTAPQRYCNG